MSTLGVLIWGGVTGQAGVVAGVIHALGYQIEALVDTDINATAQFEEGIFVAGEDAIETYLSSANLPRFFVVAIGSSGQARCQVADKLMALGMEPLTLIHPSAWVASSATIEPGCQILGASAISENARLGRQTIVNTNATIDHDTVIGQGVHIMLTATLTGLIEVGDYATIGANATVLPRLKVGRHGFVGAGAVVTKHVPDNTTVIGVPARVKMRTGDSF
ncbi:NeuD/PglB/VioB family sugar acetyltransferase [Alteromonas gracilis]|uniref:NeuD/PglB/VioB family sugar acetyltransferase n=1 Tax=Alteromonas gracilis TaxID=1479524 RepID=UPI0030D0150D